MIHIDNLKQEIEGCSFVHIFMEGNSMADGSVKEGVNIVEELLIVFEFSESFPS